MTELLSVSRFSRIRGLAAASLVTSASLALMSAPGAMSATYRAHDDASLQAALASANSNRGPSTIELSGTTFHPTSTLSVTGNVSIVGPSAAPGPKLDGGAVSPFPSDLLVVRAHAKATLWNLALTTGGGAGSAAIDDFGAVDLESSTVAGNNGPGVLVQPGATATVRNSTLSDGLDYGLVDLGSASLFNATVAGNVNGGVDSSRGTLKLINTIVASNGASDCTRAATISDHSLDSDGSCGVGALSKSDPRLGRLAANGGPTPTRALGPGSPAIDAGTNATCPAEDQRHFPRSDGRCDVGAYEAGAVAAGAPGASRGGGPGRSTSPGGAAGVLVGISGHGVLRGARRSRIAFAVRALIGQSRASFLYVDRASRVALRALRVRSLTIDGRRGIATLRGSCAQASRRRTVTIVLSSNAGRSSLRIRTSRGYFKSGSLLSGSITFLSRPGRAARVTSGMPRVVLPMGSGAASAWQALDGW
jgi:hypothetical protein